MKYFVLSALFFASVVSLPLASGAECMGPYPPSMVRAFNQNCASDPKLAGFCGCIMNEVQRNIPLADFIEVGNSAGGINADPRFIKASKKCSAQLPDVPVAGSSAKAQNPAPVVQKITPVR
jgi:hypothetical protein